MPNDKHSATGKPTVATTSTSSKALGQSGMDCILPGNFFLNMRLTFNHDEDPARGPLNIRTTPQKDGVGNAAQQPTTSHAQSTAIASQDNHQTSIDEAITEALAGVSSSATDSLKKSKSTKSKGGPGGGPGRKRDHDTMTNASRLANDSGGGSVVPSSSKNPAHDGDNSVQPNKFQRILPKEPGPAQLGSAGQEQGSEGMMDSGHSHANQAISGSQAANGANQTPEGAPPVLPFLSGQVLAWLPTSMRVAASSARSYVQAMVSHNEQWCRKYSGDRAATQTAIMKDETVLQEWDTTLRAFVAVATAARQGRQLDHRPLLHNGLTDFMNIKLPDPDQPHGDKQPAVSGNMQPGVIHGGSPIIMGMNPMGAGTRQVEELSEEIGTVIRISSRNESVRQSQHAQLHNLLVNQVQAYAQGFQDLQAAHRRADEARERESNTMLTLIKKRSEMLDEEEG